jgi:hypothetical protein
MLKLIYGCMLAPLLIAQDLSLHRVTLEAGVPARSVHLADFNGDGKLDIAVLNVTGMGIGNLAVMLRTAGGYSAPITTSTGGMGSWSMAVADFNHDGKMDVAVTNNFDDNVTILLGKGDGTFRVGGYYPTHVSPTAIVAADFNRDGHADLAVVNGGSGDVTILMGNGDGSFSSSASIYLGSSPTDVVSADFNGDGIPDLAVTNGALFLQEVVVLLGNGDGTFRIGQTAITGDEPFALIAGQFSRGGKADLAVANLASNNVSVLAGAGDGTFQPGATYVAGDGPVAIAAADFNADGVLDLAVCNDVSGDVSIYLGNGDGTFQAARSLGTGGSPTSITVGDLNGDGRKDIVTAGLGGVVLLLSK